MDSRRKLVHHRGLRVRPWSACALALAALALWPTAAVAQTTYYWGGSSGTYSVGGPGTWNSGTPWRVSSTNGTLSTYANGTNAVFFSGTGGTLTIASGTVQVNRINVASTATGTYTLSSGTLEFVGASNGITVASGKTIVFGTSLPRIQQGTGAGTLSIDGGGTVQFGRGNQVYSGWMSASGTGTTLRFVGTNSLDNGSSSSTLTVSGGATAEINATTNDRAALNLGGAGTGGGTLKLGTSTGLVTQSGFSLSVSGTSKSNILSTLGNTTTNSGSYGAVNGNNGGNGVFTVNSTGDASGVDLEYSAVFRNGTLTKNGAGTMRLNTGFMITRTGSSELSTFVASGTSVTVNAGTLLNEGTIYSIANVGGGLLKTTTTSGSFDQVNVTSGTFEVSRSSGLFRTLSGTTYAAGDAALNLRGGTLRYVGVNTDYSNVMSALGGVTSTIDTNGQSVTFATGLTGTGGLAKSGSGTLALSGSGSYSGGTRLASGTLVVGNNFALGATTGSLAVNAGLLDLNGKSITVGLLTGSNGATITTTTGNATLTANSAASGTYAGTIAGSVEIVKQGTGTLTLTGANTYSGTTTVSAGVLTITSTSALPGWDAAGRYQVAAGATLAVTNTVDDASVSTMLTTGNFAGSSAIGFDTAAGDRTYAPSIANTVSGALGLVKIGGNTLTLSAVNTYTGQTSIASGTLRLTGGDNRLATSGTLAFTGSGGLDVTTTSQTLAGLLTPASGTTSLVITGAGGALTVNSGDVQIGPGGPGGGNVANSQVTLDMSGLSNFTFNNAAGTFRVGLKLSSSNTGSVGQVATATLAGTNSITAALLAVGDSNANNDGGGSTLYLGQANTLRNGTINVGSSNRSDATLQFGPNLLPNPTVTIRGTNGADPVTNWLVGNVAQITSNQQTFTATVDLSAGTTDALVTTLRIGSADTGTSSNRAGIQNSTFTFGSGTLSAQTITVGRITSSTTSVLAGVGATYGANGTLTIANAAALVSATNIFLAENTFTGTGSAAKSVSGTVNISAGTLQAQTIALGLQTGTNDVTVSSALVFTGGTIANLPGANLTISAIPIMLSSGTGTFAADLGQTITVDGTAPISGAGALVKSGDGTLVLSTTNTFTGVTTVAGGTLALANSLALQNSPFNTGGAGVLRLPAATTAVTLGGLAGSGAFAPDNYATLTTLTLNTQTGVTASYAGGLGDGAPGMAVVKTGAGTQVFTGSNGYTGGTTLALGTIVADADAALGPSTLIIAGGTLTQLQVPAGRVIPNAITFTSGAAFGNGVLQATGSGFATLTGSITINANTTAGGHFGSGGAATLVVAGPVTSSVAVNARIGTVVFSGSGSAYGQLIISEGTVRLGAADTLPTSATVTFNRANSSNNVLDLGGFDQTLAGFVVGGSSGTTFIGNSSTTADSTLTLTGTSTFATVIQDSLGGGTRKVNLVVAGGTTTLTGASTFTGSTRLDAGTLVLGNASALGGSTVDTQAGAAGMFSFGTLTSATFGGLTGSNGLVLENASATAVALAVGGNGGSTTYGGGLSGVGSLTKAGAGTLTLTGSNGYTGATTVAAGTLAIAGGGSIASSAGVSIASGATLDVEAASGAVTVGTLSGAGSVILGGNTLTANVGDAATFGGSIAGAGGFTKAGTAKLTLSNAQPLTGRVTVAAGELELGGADVLQAASSILVGVAAGSTATLSSGAGLTVHAGQTLGGHGSVITGGAVSFLAGSTVSPGGSVGQLAIAADVSWAGDSAYVFQLTSATGTAGSEWDLLSTASLTINATPEDRYRVVLTSLTSGTDQAPGPLAGGNWNPNADYQWLFVTTGSVIDFNADAFTVEHAATFDAYNTVDGLFAVVRGDSIGKNDTDLYVVYTAAVPEPAACLLAAAGLACLAWRCRRRRR